ncbi:hypothetical protein VTO73DRAFT_14056 [Trametes versicolor]
MHLGGGAAQFHQWTTSPDDLGRLLNVVPTLEDLTLSFHASFDTLSHSRDERYETPLLEAISMHAPGLTRLSFKVTIRVPDLSEDTASTREPLMTVLHAMLFESPRNWRAQKAARYRGRTLPLLEDLSLAVVAVSPVQEARCVLSGSYVPTLLDMMSAEWTYRCVYVRSPSKSDVAVYQKNRPCPGGARLFTRLVYAPATEAAELMAEHARDVCTFPEDFVRHERIPAANCETNAGRIVHVGWSLGGASVEAVLTHAGAFPVGDVHLSKYVRRVVIYDTSCLIFGYPRPVDWYHPSSDPTIQPIERPAAFDQSIGNYFTHGDPWTHGGAALEHRSQAPDIVSTTARMSVTELAVCAHPRPAQVGGSDYHLIGVCVEHGTYGALKDGSMYLQDSQEDADAWSAVEVRVVWCDRSPWEMVWAVYLLDEEIKEAWAAGKPLRNISLVRLKGANHFVGALFAVVGQH